MTYDCCEARQRTERIFISSLGNAGAFNLNDATMTVTITMGIS